MSKQKNDPPQSGSKRRSRRRSALLGCLVAGCVGLVVGARALVLAVACHCAESALSTWSVSDAKQWLSWAECVDSQNSTVLLLKAACYRHLDQMTFWTATIDAARRAGVSAECVRHEVILGMLKWDADREYQDAELFRLVDSGVSLDDLVTSLVQHALEQGQLDRAKALLDQLRSQESDAAHVAYLSGLYWESRGQPAQAAAQWQAALEQEPRHELAGLRLAKLYEDQHQLDRSIKLYGVLATRFVSSIPVRLGLVRVLRQLGRYEDAALVLKAVVSRTDADVAVTLEQARLALEMGDYSEGMQRFATIPLDDFHDKAVLTAAATTFALGGQADLTDRVFQRVAHDDFRAVRRHDLQSRLATCPDDVEAKREVSQATAATRSEEDRLESLIIDTRDDAQLTDTELYQKHCGACHGREGDGNGRAARHLFPKPRDLKTGYFRLVSTLSGIPTVDDLQQTIRDGMPGTSMPSFASLGDAAVHRLTQETWRLHREGLRTHFIQLLTEADEEIDAEAIDAMVDLRTHSGPLLKVPPSESRQTFDPKRAKAVYHRLSCDTCHGEDGGGAVDARLFDERNRPVRPRDLVHEPFKGGADAVALYRRLALGMPGTPHPANPSATDAELMDLVEWCQSIASPTSRRLSNHDRSVLLSTDAYRQWRDFRPAE